MSYSPVQWKGVDLDGYAIDSPNARDVTLLEKICVFVLDRPAITEG